MLYFWKAEGSRMSNMTFPCVNTIQVVPTMQKKLFTSSFQAKFLKIRFLKVACTWSFLMYMQIFFSPSLYHSYGHIWAKISRYAPPLTPKKRPKTDPYRPKMAKRVVLPHFRERVDESPRQDENFGTFGLFLSFFVSEIWPFKVENPVRAIFSLYF